MASVTKLVEVELAKLADEASSLVFMVGSEERAAVAQSFAIRFKTRIEDRGTQEQIEVMEGEGCPNFPED